MDSFVFRMVDDGWCCCEGVIELSESKILLFELRNTVELVDAVLMPNPLCFKYSLIVDSCIDECVRP